MNNFADYLIIDLNYIKDLKDENKKREEQEIQLKSQLEEENTKLKQLLSQNQEIQNHLREVEQERDNLKKFSDRILSIIPSKNDDNDIVSTIERDINFSKNIRNIFMNNLETRKCCKNKKFKKTYLDTLKIMLPCNDDSWIPSQIEEKIIQSDELSTKNKELISQIEKETQGYSEIIELLIPQNSNICKITKSGVFH